MSRRRNPDRRQELYDRISESSAEEVTHEEMVRLGFWSRAQEFPSASPRDLRRMEELDNRLQALRTERSRLGNVEAMLKAVRKRRLMESRRKREETKDRRLRERAERAAAWKVRQSREIVYLGQGVSAGLGDKEANLARLRAQSLPEIVDPAALAAAMGGFGVEAALFVFPPQGVTDHSL